MKHFICTGGCGGSSATSGTCAVESCPNFGKDLVECNCDTGKHESLMNQCVNCGNPIPQDQKVCADGKCSIEAILNKKA